MPLAWRLACLCALILLPATVSAYPSDRTDQAEQADQTDQQDQTDPSDADTPSEGDDATAGAAMPHHEMMPMQMQPPRMASSRMSATMMQPPKMTSEKMAPAEMQRDILTGTVALVSDYRFRGVSVSDQDWAIQGGLHSGSGECLCRHLGLQHSGIPGRGGRD